ncbi:MAG: hypothetical protein ACREP3_15385 [Candidatus Binatia bacterium]
MAEIRLATEAGEVAGTCVGPRTVWQQTLEKGEVIPVLQVTAAPAPDFPKEPLAIDLAKTEEARKLIEVGVHHDSAIALTYALPPGTPKDLIAVLRRAFVATMKDAEFAGELKKARLDVDPSGRPGGRKDRERRFQTRCDARRQTERYTLQVDQRNFLTFACRNCNRRIHRGGRGSAPAIFW